MTQDQQVIVVEGAGTDAVNGEYFLTSVFDGVGRYSKFGVWEGQRKEFVLFLYRCHIANGYKRWYISIVPHGVSPGKSTDIDFYKTPSYTDDDGRHYEFPPSDSWQATSAGKAPAPTVTFKEGPKIFKKVFIPTEIATAYKELLLSEEFSDVRLICDDRVAIPAHKCILAVASPYFKAIFTGPWKENESGELHMAYSADIIRAMLTLLYTGNLNSEAIQNDPFSFMSLASEYRIQWIKPLIEPVCIRVVEATNLKSAWQCSRLHECTLLKAACIQFVKEKPLTVLLHGDMTSLVTEDPASWDELSKALSDET